VEVVVGAVLFASVVAVLFTLIRLSARRVFGSARRLEADLGRDALRHRLERGEITQAEYDAGVEALGKG